MDDRLRSKYLVFLSRKGWDFMALSEYERRRLGPLRSERVIEGLGAFMAWAQKHYKMGGSRSLSEREMKWMLHRLGES